MPTTPAQAPYPHFGDVGLCDLIACKRDYYDGHEYWDNATDYARDHHPDGTVCTHMGPCDSPTCHKRPGPAATIREIIATAQIHGGTRVLELTATPHPDKDSGRVWHSTVTAYDSNHPQDERFVSSGWYDELDLAGAELAGSLDITPDEDGFCNCWIGWDPHCGHPSCWGISTS